MRPPSPSRALLASFGLLLIACAGSPPPASTPQVPALASSPDASVPAPDPALLAVPGPAASPCTTDETCLHYRCNPLYGKCAFPCVTNADCMPGTTCFQSAISTCQATPPGNPGKETPGG